MQGARQGARQGSRQQEVIEVFGMQGRQGDIHYFQMSDAAAIFRYTHNKHRCFMLAQELLYMGREQSEMLISAVGDVCEARDEGNPWRQI